MNFLPTKDERTDLRSYLMQPGSSATLLCECEKFMVAMIGVQHATRKLSAIQFMQGFTNCLEDLRRDTRIIQRACDEIMGSIRFRKVLGITLALGNHLNTVGKNGREPAGAITMDSLLKLNQTKAFDRQTTFLNFVVSSIRRNKASLIHFKDEMPSIFKVEKMQWSLVMFEMERMERGIDEIRKIALHYSLIQAGLASDDACTVSSSMMPLNREVELLQTTSVGRFTLDACLRLAVLVSEVDKTKDKGDALFQYFGEAHKSTAQADAVFNTVCAFTRDFDRALDEVIAQEKMTMREKRGVPIVRSATKSFDEGESAPPGHHKSLGGGMMGVLSEIKKKKTKAALVLWRRGKTE
jgi:Formin Homology 2 Domain